MLQAGIDLGSKTVKCVLLDEDGRLLWSSYELHRGRVRPALAGCLEGLARAAEEHGAAGCALALTGSGATGLAQELGVLFVQEVAAARCAVQALHPGADAFVELGGEDAKLVYLRPPVEQRMNTSCAGGTGSFLEDVAALMGVGMAELNRLAAAGQPAYAIASRCAVFALRDIKPLLAAGAPREDVAASVLQAVVDQTLSTLACGRPLEGSVLFLGGPMEHLPALVERFRATLGLAPECAVTPAHAKLMPAWGAALKAQALGAAAACDCRALAARVAGLVGRSACGDAAAGAALEPLDLASALAAEPAEGEEQAAAAPGAGRPRRVGLADAEEPLYAGFDAGSTTLKLAIVDAQGRLAHTAYEPAPARMQEAAAQMLAGFRAAWAQARGSESAPRIARMVACGYGEEMLVESLGADAVLAETAAHLAGALALFPQASFVLDIGGQDMKALWVRGGQLDRTVVNETCSSGCGAFMSSAAASMGLSLAELDAAALRATAPVDLGARCTVFMRSRVRAAQEQGATQEDIAAGAAHAVARNALRRLIGPKRLGSLGECVVVQGGAFASDAVLAAFAQELGRPVHRSPLAPVAGALGAALTAREQALCGAGEQDSGSVPNVVACQQELLASYASVTASGPRAQLRIGFVPAMNCYETLPFWHTLLSELGFSVLVPHEDAGAPVSQAEVGATLLSDTVCLPAQMAHRMSLQLARAGASCIFAPSFERAFHCAISSEYARILPDALAGVLPGLPVYAPNVLTFAPKRFMRNADAQQELFRFLVGLAPAACPLEQGEYEHALKRAFAEQKAFEQRVEEAGRAALEWVHERPERHGIILCGRSYHTAPELLNGLDGLLAEQGFAVIAPLAVNAPAREARGPLVDKSLNASMEAVWRAAKHFLGYAALAVGDEQLDLVCLQSFGCGMDAVSLVDVERMLEDHGKPFTLIKLDSKTDPAHTRIRLRALADAVRARKRAGVQARALDAGAMLGGVVRTEDFGAAEAAAARKGLGSKERERHAEQPFAESTLSAAAALAAGEGEREGGAKGVSESRSGRRAKKRGDASSAEALLAKHGEGAGVSAGASAAGEGEVFSEVLPFEGLSAEDVDYATRALPADMCGTAALLAAYAIRRAHLHPGMQIALPDCCELCLTNAVQHLMLMEGLSNPVYWEASPERLPYEDARAAAGCVAARAVGVAARSDEHAGTQVLVADTALANDARADAGAAVGCAAADTPAPARAVGVAGNPLLLFDARANQGLLDAARQQGAQLCFPAPGTWFTDPEHYLPQLESLHAQGARHVLWLQSFCCLKEHVHVRGALPQLRRRFPGMEISIIDIDPQASPLNARNRLLLALESMD